MDEDHRKALVIGHGSAGYRHGAALQGLGLEVAVVSRRPLEGGPGYATAEAGLEGFGPDYVVVADETARHAESLGRLAAAGFAGTVLVEKPLFDRDIPVPDNAFAGLYVGYQLRYHPAIRALRRHLPEAGRIVSARAYVGQHLATWRPARPYAESYSARATAGGGALRDLSHEIDLLLWLLGPWTRLTALGGNHAVLEIDSDDAYALLLETRDCPLATLQLNYLDRPGRRTLLVNGAAATLEADLVAGTLTRDGEALPLPGPAHDATEAMHAAVLSGAAEEACDAAQGRAVMHAIAAAEAAVAQRQWIAA